MNIVVNGEQREAAEQTTVRQLLQTLQLNDKPVAVEVNCELVPRQQHEHHVLQDGDQLEVVTLVGGG